MIGVIAKRDQTAVVEEFFELFKTPWEFCRPGGFYDVVVSTADAIPDRAPRLLISYGAARKSDDPHSIVPDESHPGGMVIGNDGPLPIYAGLLTFKVDQTSTVCLKADAGIVGLRPEAADSGVIRVGYDLFEEVRFLLSIGQPVENAHIPALDVHIAMLRRWILAAGIPIMEVPPSPAGHGFAVCLTHDIDFVGIRRHKLDHTIWGFLYRSSIGAVQGALRGRIPVRRLLKIWRAAASLPFVYLGWVEDFWEPFAWYLKTEANLPATYYLIPFKGRPGNRVTGRGAARRGTAYDVTDVEQWATRLVREGCEVGVHGIDAWHNVDKGREELARITAVTGESTVGVRMHWLLQDASTASVLERSGYAYDSTNGYNETVGYRNGTSQVYRPLGARTLLELPLHIQDGALFYPQRLGLSEAEADDRCQGLIEKASQHGGVLTVLWHDRSHGPERFWGDFYVSLVQKLRGLDPWFTTAAQLVGWFDKRREARFERLETPQGTKSRLRYDGAAIQPPLRIRFYQSPSTFRETVWDGTSALHLDSAFGVNAPLSSQTAAMAIQAFV